MYKFLLCWRYLRTRWIALASIISVMLGVATMIIVNSVMAGFTHEMQNRMKGILGELIVEARSLEGAPDFDGQAALIRKVAGDEVEGVTPAVVVPAMLSFHYGGTWITRQVDLIGIDEKTQGSVTDSGKYLQHPENRREMSFTLREDGYDLFDHQAEGKGLERLQMRNAGWPHRREWARIQAIFEKERRSRPETDTPKAEMPAAIAANPVTPASATEEKKPSVADPFAARKSPFPASEETFDPAKEQHTGAVLGMAMVSFRTREGEDRFLALPGDDVKLTFPTTGQPPQAVSDNFTVVDFYESKMAAYDSKFVFVPIRKLQELRGMGEGSINAIQIKLKPGVNGEAVRDKLRAAFPQDLFVVSTWREKERDLLAAVDMETAILNILLFLIIAVAGFGILAIFYMIVVEKTRDIGIMKSLGASGRGVMGIFLSYGLSLGLVGSGVGMVAGLLFVRYINQIADFLGWITGRPVFNPEIYYFYKIPAIVFPTTVAWIVAGALGIAVLASVLPARRAAGLHPVRALRYE